MTGQPINPALAVSDSPLIAHFEERPFLIVGRSRDADLPIYDTACSRRQFLVRRHGQRFMLEPLSENTPTFCDGLRATGPVPITDRSLIQAGTSTFRLLFATTDAAPPKAVPTPMNAANAHPTVRGVVVPRDIVPIAATVALDGDVIFGRDPGANGIVLTHPLVSRRHALVRRTHDGAVLKDLGSANGTYINGKKVGTAIGLRRDDRIQIGPYGLRFTGESLVPTHDLTTPITAGSTQLIAWNLGVTVDGQQLLHEVSLAFHANEFTAILGPSGCGKSTLMRSLTGLHPPSRGRVLFDGCDLYHAPAGAIRCIAVVPQKEILPLALTVENALRFSARLRLPPDTSAEGVQHAVDSVLAVVGLNEQRKLRIAKLSGGQLKRVGLANELLADPGLVLLDETTSGLDEQADRELMAMFRQTLECRQNGDRRHALADAHHGLLSSCCHSDTVGATRVLRIAQGRPELFPHRPSRATFMIGSMTNPPKIGPNSLRTAPSNVCWNRSIRPSVRPFMNPQIRWPRSNTRFQFWQNEQRLYSSRIALR